MLGLKSRKGSILPADKAAMTIYREGRHRRYVYFGEHLSYYGYGVEKMLKIEYVLYSLYLHCKLSKF